MLYAIPIIYYYFNVNCPLFSRAPTVTLDFNSHIIIILYIYLLYNIKAIIKRKRLAVYFKLAKILFL